MDKIHEKAVLLTIVEGKFHQVKRMMKSVNNKVTYLKRMAFGKMELGDLVEGEIKEITLKNLI